MKLSLIVGIIATACAMSALADNASKVRIVYADGKEANSAYIFRPNLVVSKEGLLHFDFEVIRDIPSDASFVIKVGALKNENDVKSYKELHSYTVKNFCTNEKDPNHQYLPELKKGSKCWQKGRYTSDNYVLFPFYNVLSDAELKSPWFLVRGKIIRGSSTLLGLELKYKSI